MLNSELFQIISEHLAEYDGKILMCKGQYCAGKAKCFGIFYFDSKDRPVIKVATGNKTKDQCAGFLVHEYCHFLQWESNCKLWQQFTDQDFNFYDIISSPKDNKEKIKLLLNIEHDCEKRSVKFLKKNNIADIRAYSKLANIILYKYAYLYLYDKWPTTSIKPKSKILNNAPDKLLAHYEDYLNIPKEILELL